MSTNLTPPSGTGTKVSDFLSQLSNVGGEIGLVANIAGIAIPLIKGVITKIKSTSLGGTTVEYTVVLTTTQAELDGIVSGAGADLADINAELAKLKLPPLAPINPTP